MTREGGHGKTLTLGAWPTGGTKAKAKKAKDYSDLMKKEPEKIFKEDPAMTEMGLPMAFGKKGVNGHTISLGHPNQQVPGSAAAFKLKQKQEAERAADSAARARVARAAGDEEDEEGAAASRGTRGGAEAARAEDDDDDDSDGDGDDDEDDEDEDDEATDPADDDDPLGIPMKKSISLVHCDEYCIRRVSALSIDPAGSRMITGSCVFPAGAPPRACLTLPPGILRRSAAPCGHVSLTCALACPCVAMYCHSLPPRSYDYHVKFWDFNGMDHRSRPGEVMRKCRQLALQRTVWTR